MQATMRLASPPAGGTWLRPRLSISRAPLVSGEGPEMPAPASGHRVLDRLQQRVLNPVVKLGWNLGIPIPGDALLETTGRRTGLPRRTPVCDGLDGERFWLISQRGREADWVRNIEANPRVRVKVSGLGSRWRSGTAHIVDSDDPDERQRILGETNLARRRCVSSTPRPDTSPPTRRID